MYCSHCGSQIDDSAKFCPNCGASVSGPGGPSAPAGNPAEQVQALPMKWFKFLIYFSLFVSCALNVGFAVQMLTGFVYGGTNEAELVYSVFPGMKTLDVLIGILALISAALAIYARFRLARFRVNGPMMLTVLYVMAVLTNLVYLIGAGLILQANGYTLVFSQYSSIIISFVASIAMIFINKTYFHNRAHLFVN